MNIKLIVRLLLITYVMTPLTTFAGITVEPEPNIFEDVSIISESKIENIIKERLYEEDGFENVTVSLRDNRNGIKLKHTAPSYEVNFEDIDINKRSRRFTATLAFMDDGKNQENVLIKGSYAEIVSIPVLSSNLQRGSVITEDKIRWINEDKHMLKGDTITDEEDLLGKSLKVAIPANRQIRKMNIENPTMVFRNETIDVTYSTNFIKIKAVGIAMEDGSEGDRVRLKNPDSQKIITGIITGRKTVKIL